MSRKLKSQTIYRADHLPGEPPQGTPEGQPHHSRQEYDEQGNLLLEASYSSTGALTEKNEYRYDPRGRLVETIMYDEDGGIMERRTARRDSTGRLVQEQVHYLDGSVDTYHYSYDDNGHLTGLEVIDDEDSLEYSEQYFWEGDALVKTERYDESGKATFRQEDIYENGILSERKTWSDEESESYTLVQRFNERGIREQELRYDSRNQLIERNIFEDDGSGKIIRIIEENKQRKNTTDFGFDDEGRLVHQVERDLNGDLNHEAFRKYGENGDLDSVTVEVNQKNSGTTLAYTLFYRYEYF